MNTPSSSFGTLLRNWRRRRRLSQLDLAIDADISQRHLSFLESGRSVPSRGMLLRLAEQLRIPIRERNPLLVAAGFAPLFQERAFDDPGFEQARHAVELVLEAHTPYPALAIDRHWTLLLANKPAMLLLAGIPPALLEPPINVLRISLHPQGLAARIRNLDEWREHVLTRLARQIDESGDETLMELLKELQAYGTPVQNTPPERSDLAGIAVPLELELDAGTLSFLSTTTVFGTAVDISLAELAIESFLPANQATAEVMRALMAQT